MKPVIPFLGQQMATEWIPVNVVDHVCVENLVSADDMSL